MNGQNGRDGELWGRACLFFLGVCFLLLQIVDDSLFFQFNLKYAKCTYGMGIENIELFARIVNAPNQ